MNINKTIKIGIICNNAKTLDLMQKIITYSEQSIRINTFIFEPTELDKILDTNLDFLYVENKKENLKNFNWDFYSRAHDINADFKLILINKQFSPEDKIYYKGGADDIIYYSDGYDYLKWKLLALFRRHWDKANKSTTIIHRGLVVDLTKQSFLLNSKNLNLTKKETLIFGILMNNFLENKWITKKQIFFMVYGITGHDKTRIIDQHLHKLKTKIGKSYFLIDKIKGIKIV